MNNRGMARRLIGVACTAAFLITGAQAQFSGAIYTTLPDGQIVNANLFPDKESVYLNGGPQGMNSAGLPAGEYYFQVTDPSGTVLLSTDDIRNRRLLVAVNGGGAGVVSGSLPDPADPIGFPGHANGSFNGANGSTPVQLMPYDDTPNNGGEYKVWLTPVSRYAPGFGTNGFLGAWSKTDNFKVRSQEPPPNPQGLVSGVKYYDANLNGQRDAGELTIQNWEITIVTPGETFVVTTNINGEWILELDEGTSYTACETQVASWIQTGPIPGATIFFNGNVIATADANQCWEGVVPVSDPGTIIFGHDFGNVLLGGGGGKTLGFWSNKNGQRRMNDTLGMAAALAGLSAQNLRNANGTDFDPSNYNQFKSWLLDGNATNMAYMLSVQYAAMWLNINAVDANNPGVDPNAMIYAPGTTSANFLGFATVGAVMAEANIELGIHGTALANDPWRSYQEALKNALDNANNNLNFVQNWP